MDIRYGRYSRTCEDRGSSSSSPKPLNTEKGTKTSEVSSQASVRGEEKSPFSGQEIKQVKASFSASDVFKASYRDSNRAAVVLGLAGGVVGGLHGGSSGASIGMSVGSGLGAHLGGMAGMARECSALSHASIDDVNLEQEIQDIAQSSRFLDRVVQVVDHTGHHAAVGSIVTGSAVLLGSLAAGIPFSAAFHAAGIYSGAAWAFGLTTGSADWILRHVRQSEEAMQREERSSPGEIEMSPLTFVESGPIQK